MKEIVKVIFQTFVEKSCFLPLCPKKVAVLLPLLTKRSAKLSVLEFSSKRVTGIKNEFTRTQKIKVQ